MIINILFGLFMLVTILAFFSIFQMLEALKGLNDLLWEKVTTLENNSDDIEGDMIIILEEAAKKRK